MFDPLIPGVDRVSRKDIIAADQPRPLSQGSSEVATKLTQRICTRAAADLQQALATSYAQHFTEQEIKEALAFYKTPLGKKLVTARAEGDAKRP